MRPLSRHRVVAACLLVLIFMFPSHGRAQSESEKPFSRVGVAVKVSTLALAAKPRCLSANDGTCAGD